MKRRILAVLVCLAVAAFLVPLRAGQRGVDETRWRVRIVVSNVDVVKASLETSGYDVLETNSADSTLELVVSASEIRALERSGFTVVRIEQSRPLEQVLQPKPRQGLPRPWLPTRPPRRSRPRTRNLAGVLDRMQADRRRLPGDCEVRGHHRDVQHTAHIQRAAHVRAEDLRQRQPRRGRNGDADRRDPPRAGDQRARHRPRGRRAADRRIRRRHPRSRPRSTATRSGLLRSGIRMATTTSSPPTTCGGRTAGCCRAAWASTRTATTPRRGQRPAPAAPVRLQIPIRDRRRRQSRRPRR